MACSLHLFINHYRTNRIPFNEQIMQLNKQILLHFLIRLVFYETILFAGLGIANWGFNGSSKWFFIKIL
ncbi:hypothetical protein GAMM_170010 [Gammaproteobacteria bacterium]